MDDAGMPPDKFHSVEDLRKLPLLTKDEYREWIAETYCRAPDRYDRWFRDGTSGSTGSPLVIYRPWKEQAYIIAKWLRELVINGYRPMWDKTFCLVSPHRLASRDSILQRVGLYRRSMLSYLASPREMVDAFNQARPHLFYANKSQFIQMASYAKHCGVDLYKPPLYACGAETIDDASRRLIYECFGERGFIESYGCVELGILAFQETRDKSFLHFCHDTNILELITHDESDPDEGNCVITDLHQYAFPLVRYNLGDYLVTKRRDNLQVILRITGRQDDWIVFKEGYRIPFHGFYEVMERRTDIYQFRVIQEDYELIRVLVVRKPDSDPRAVRTQILADLEQDVSSGISYEVEFVDDLPPDANGKLRMLISKVPQEA
jgi:phenylacetate-coenzyme A ligase PaaK-like adenylate-forming protein